MHTMRDSIQAIQERIRSTAERGGRNPADITLVAVSKTYPSETVREAYEDGLCVFGENRLQEAEKKIEELADLDIEWHFIGRLQTNKVKKAAPLFHLIHSVDSARLIEALGHEAKKIDRFIPILLQVNVGEEESKSGVSAGELEVLLEAVQRTSHLSCRGLMAIPPYESDPEDVRPWFIALRELGEKYRHDLIGDADRLELSMGMSHDFHVAIEEGATLIRVGTAIFGARM